MQKMNRAGELWQEDDLDEIMALLEKDYTKPRQEPSVLQLMSGMDAKEPPEKKNKPAREKAPKAPGAGKKKAEPAGQKPWEEYIPQEPHRVGTGEQPDFDETPVKPKKEWAVIPLSVVAALEIAAIVAVVIWWQQWII